MKVTSWMLEAALLGLEAQKGKVEGRISLIRQMQGESAGKLTLVKSAKRQPTIRAKQVLPKKAKRVLSPEGRRRISEALKKHWAEKKIVVVEVKPVHEEPVQTELVAAAS